jgi:hypothetical protein
MKSPKAKTLEIKANTVIHVKQKLIDLHVRYYYHISFSRTRLGVCSIKKLLSYLIQRGIFDPTAIYIFQLQAGV